MEITKDALVHVIKAERLAEKLSDFIQCMLSGDGRPWNMADEIASHLSDMIREMSGEDRDTDFEESAVQILLRSSLDAEHVAEEIMNIAEDDEPKQPKPNLITRDQFNAMVRKYGGYSTPEGEWK